MFSRTLVGRKTSSGKGCLYDSLKNRLYDPDILRSPLLVLCDVGLDLLLLYALKPYRARFAVGALNTEAPPLLMLRLVFIIIRIKKILNCK